MATPPLPAGYTLDSSASVPPLPSGYKLDTPGSAQEPQVDQKMVDALHQAYDSRPLWRKVLGLEPDPDSLSPDLKNFQQQQKQAAVQHVTSSLQNQASGMKEGAIAGAKMAPFMMLGPAGEAVSGAVGGGGLGLAANAATQAVGAGAISKLEGASNTGAGINAALGAAGPMVSKGLELASESGAPERLYQSALKPSTRMDPQKVANAVQTGLQEGIPVSKGGLAKLGDLIDDVNSKIQDTIDSAPNRPINKFAVTSRLADTAQRFSQQVNPNADLKAIGDSGNEFLENQPGAIPSSTAQALKTGTYQQLSDKAYGELSSATVESQKALARGLKEELAKNFPELDQLNAKDSQYYNLQGTLEKAVQRISNHNVVPLGGAMAGAATKAVTNSNPLSMAAGFMKQVLDDPNVKSRLAIILAKSGVALPQITSRLAQASTGLAQYAVSSNTAPRDDQSDQTQP